MGYAKKTYPYRLFAYKTVDQFASGVPDVLLCGNGKFGAMELKMPGKQASSIQSFFLTQIANAGGVTAVIDNFEDGVTFLDRLMKG